MIRGKKMEYRESSVSVYCIGKSRKYVSQETLTSFSAGINPSGRKLTAQRQGSQQCWEAIDKQSSLVTAGTF